MGTRSRIALQTGDTIRSIYVHWAGYPSHHGPKLLGHYDTVDKINALLDLGDLSSLGNEIGEKHDQDLCNPAHDEWCVAHMRDGSDPDFDAHAALHSDQDDLIAYADQCNAEYIYLFTDGLWKVCEPGEDWQDLYLTYIAEKLTT